MENILQKIAMVQLYIHYMKNVEVIINVPNNPRDLMLLEVAYSVSSAWYSKSIIKGSIL